MANGETALVSKLVLPVDEAWRSIGRRPGRNERDELDNTLVTDE
jgi:hypothetical protein